MPESAWVKAIFTPAFFNVPALLRNAVEGSGRTMKQYIRAYLLKAPPGAIGPSDHEIPQATPAPRMAPVAQRSVHCKQGSRGQRLVKGQANLPNFLEEAGPSGKGSGKSGHRSANVKGHQATHCWLQKLAKQSTASKHYQACAHGHVKHAIFTTPTQYPP